MNDGYDKERIDALRREVFNNKYDYSEFAYYFYKSLKEAERGRSYTLRIGDAVYDSYNSTAPLIRDGELIVGRIADWNPSPEQAAEWKALNEYAVAVSPALHGQASHMTIDYDLLLNKGVYGIMADIDNYRKNLDLSMIADIEKDNFYASALRALEGLVRFAERYAEEAERQAATCADPKRKGELQRIAGIMRKVPAKPAGSFYEAVQSVHFTTFALSAKPFMGGCHQYQLGRPDRYLWKFYEADIQAGKITPEEARTLLDCLAICINNRVPSGLSSGYMIGGRDKSGAVVSNDLTRMLMQVIDDVNLVYPSVGLCCCKDTPDEDMALASEILGRGHSHPAFFNDEVITEGLRYHGMGETEACDYIHSTCVEITPIASSNVWVASPYTNMAQKLLDILDRDYHSMDELLASYFAHMEKNIRNNLINEIRWRVERARYAQDPLLSCFVNDCLKNAKDIEQGGARYNWIMPSFVGLSNTADAFLVIEKMIFGRGELSFAKLRSALVSNFSDEGGEALRQRILNAVPKYGNDNDEADAYVVKITGWLTKEMEKYQPRGGTYLVPSLFCWIMHDEFGKVTGATPDGRKAGFPLGDGSGPAQGREMAGPTAAIISSTKWDHRRFSGGIAVNMKFSKRLFSRESVPKLKALVKTYLERGGFETQINVVDKDVLLKAKTNPDAYRDLVVRIGGYSDYFVKLSPTLQDEVIQRTEYQI